MPDWKKSKKGETIEYDGDTLHWCKHHVHTEVLWDSLYMSHKLEYHDSWKEEKNQRYGKKKRSKTIDSTPPPILSLSEKSESRFDH